MREGELSDFDLKGYALVKKTASTLVDASIVTNYPALALERGTFSLQDGAALEYRVANALTLTGGAHLAIDLLETENDRFLADTVDLSGASAANPVVIDITAHGISSLAPDAMRPLIAGSGLTADDAAKFTINGFAAEVTVVDGSLVMRGRSLADFVWSGADADTNDWSAPGNWDGQSVPPSGAVAAFDLTAGGTTTFDLARFSVKGVRFGAEAGAFTHVGEERLSLLSFVTNLSQNAQSFSMPLSLGIAGQPFDLYTVGALTLSGDVATPGASLRVRGPGRLTIDDTVIAQSAEVELAAGVTRISHTGRQTTAGMPGELRIGPEAQLDLNILGTDTFAKAEPIHCKTVVLSGDGPDHEGALVNSAAGSDNVETSLIGHLKLAGDAAIGSRSTLGAGRRHA